MNKKFLHEKGITLVALVLTIIVLLILAGISIQALTNTGIFGRAEEAKKATENAQKDEYQILQDYMKEIDGINAISVAAAQANEMLTKTTNTFVKDAYGNVLTVPAGFRIKVDDTTNNAATVDKGIVIIDSNQNEFVWIPVGKIYTDEAKTEANAKTINLNRYTFDENGNPTAQNDAAIPSTWDANLKFQELSTSTSGNTTAKDIEKFKKSVETNRGYYIGRYEARKNSSGAITEVGTDNVWNNITQPNAATQARNMYDNTKPFTSDLMNSYAWDTATLFLQTCGTNTKYSRKNSVNTGSLATTGTNNQETKDVQCNVYDMASNTVEWTTETSSYSSIPSVGRGGSFNNSGNYTSIRGCYSPSNGFGNISFRPLLFV